MKIFSINQLADSLDLSDHADAKCERAHSNGPPTNENASRRGEHSSVERLAAILCPVSETIARARQSSDGIVFVIHNASKPHRGLWRRLLGRTYESGPTMVVAVSCERAVEMNAKGDIETRRWLSIPPQEGEIKIFLCAGDGTALLTLHFDDGVVGVVVEAEPLAN